MSTCNCTCPVAGSHDPDCAIYGRPLEPGATGTRFCMSCGHYGRAPGGVRRGQYVSCCAAVVNDGGKITDGCQAQRKIVYVLEDAAITREGP